MEKAKAENTKRGLIPWLKLAGGILSLAVIVSVIASGYTPPGILGQVLRNNRQNDIDASPLLYSEVEQMARFEKDVREMRRRAALRAQKIQGDKLNVESDSSIPAAFNRCYR